jgi:hypothetical protein
VRPQQPQTEPPATDTVPEPRPGNSRRNQAPADPDAEESEPTKAEREKAEREKAEREKAEREKRDEKRDD